MANVLKMAIIESILSLHAQRWSQRRIARELEVDRETVRKYLRQGLSGAKPATAPTGSGGSKPATFPGVPAPASKPATNLPTGSESEPVSKSALLAGAAVPGSALTGKTATYAAIQFYQVATAASTLFLAVTPPGAGNGN